MESSAIPTPPQPDPAAPTPTTDPAATAPAQPDQNAPTPPAPGNTGATETPAQPWTGTLDEAKASESPSTTDDLLRQLIEQQTAQRAEISQLRSEVAARQSAAAPTSTVTILSDEEKLQARMEEIEAAEFYCPGCGRLYGYARECNGFAAAPHPPIEVVSTSELTSGGDSADHTPAPPSE